MTDTTAQSANGGFRKDYRVIWLSSLAVAATVAWSTYAELDRVVRAAGQVVPSARTQIVQNLEGGIIEDLFVAEGDLVTEGQELLHLDRTRFESSVGELEQEIEALMFRAHRLRAEIAQAEQLLFPDDLAARRPDLAQLELQLFDSRRAADDVQRNSLQRLIGLRRQEVESLTPLVESGAVSSLQLLNSEVALAELETELERYSSDRQRELSETLSETVAELDRLEQSVSARRDQLRRTVLRAPASGTVNQLFFSTVGAVIGPGEPILEIVPSDDGILVEVRVGPQDIGYVRSGMRATLKVTAYDYTIFGTLTGEVERVGADTVPDPIDPNAPPAFAVSVRLDEQSLQSWLDRDLELRTGMVVEAELQAGITRVLDYILRPVMRARDGLSDV